MRPPPPPLAPLPTLCRFQLQNPGLTPSPPRSGCALNRVLGAGNALKWHQEVFRWLDEWVGDGSAAAARSAAAAAEAEAVVVAGGGAHEEQAPALVVQA